MASRDVRNLIFALVLLIVGMQAIVLVLKAYIPATNVDIDILNFTTITDIVNGLSIAIGVIIILLAPVYLYSRSRDKVAD